jgi:hypothetical protein
LPGIAGVRHSASGLPSGPPSRDSSLKTERGGASRGQARSARDPDRSERRSGVPVAMISTGVVSWHPLCSAACMHIRDIGRKFNRLTVVEDVGIVGTRYRHWVCRCDCGAMTVVRAASVRRGAIRSCGCFRQQATQQRSLKHGMASRGSQRSPEYRAWCAMLQRCCNPSNRAYARYGGRGIRVCDDWILSFNVFLADMGSRPSSAHSIERLDNDGPYEKSNCVWATREKQQRNRRGNVVLKFDGKRQTVVEWANEVGLSPSTLYSRIRLGWSAQKALTTATRRSTV